MKKFGLCSLQNGSVFTNWRNWLSLGYTIVKHLNFFYLSQIKLHSQGIVIILILFIKYYAFSINLQKKIDAKMKFAHFFHDKLAF